MKRLHTLSVITLLAAAATTAWGQSIPATDKDKSALALRFAQANIAQYMVRDLGVTEATFELQVHRTASGRRFDITSPVMPLGEAGLGRFVAQGRMNAAGSIDLTLRCETAIGEFLGSGLMTFEIANGVIVGGRGDHLIAAGPIGGGPISGPPSPPPPGGGGQDFQDYHEYWGLLWVDDNGLPLAIPNRVKCREFTYNTRVISWACESNGGVLMPASNDLGFQLPTFGVSGAAFSASGQGSIDEATGNGVSIVHLSSLPACPWEVGIAEAWCPADYNGDGSADSDDVIAFFSDWDMGESCADTDRSGSTDSNDIIIFFTAWDSGGC